MIEDLTIFRQSSDLIYFATDEVSLPSRILGGGKSLTPFNVDSVASGAMGGIIHRLLALWLW